MKYSQKTLHSSPERARYGVSFVSSKGNILCRLVKIELYKIFAIINRAIKGLHCNLSINSLSSSEWVSEWVIMFNCLFGGQRSLSSRRCGCNLKLVIFKHISTINILSIPVKLPNVNDTTPHWWKVYIGSGNDLVFDGNRPLLETRLIQIHVIKWCL